MVLVVCYVLNYVILKESSPFNRTMGAVAIGILVSYIPKIKNQKIAIPMFIVFVILSLLYAICPIKYDYTNLLYIVLVFSGLVYFASCVTFSNKYINCFCTISFGLYAYQCILRIIRFYHPLPNYIFFLILISLVIFDRLIVFAYHQIKKYKKQKQINVN